METYVCLSKYFCRAFFEASRTGLFWLLLLGTIIAALLPRLVVKFVLQNYFPNDIQICREAEKLENSRVVEAGQTEMQPIPDATRI
ncbi:hypothetical protein L6164_023280 [Bauhinia variegata]|uniref:Uncharacterized protein n=1 Tax=Bauhinia variegata TaxID=167791 RepID=A0ACB9MJP1_BAUVA|nr:hypothetical protein L6164_023280 [Bauhinia variegata]